MDGRKGLIYCERMKVILLKAVKALGKQGEAVEVTAGHARNFLFPKHLAAPATPGAMRECEEREGRQKREAHKELSVYGDLASRLDGYALALSQKVNESGTFYGAVTAAQIAQALKQKGFTQVDASMVALERPIKEPSEHTVTITLPHGFEAEVRLHIEGS